MEVNNIFLKKVLPSDEALLVFADSKEKNSFSVKIIRNEIQLFCLITYTKMHKETFKVIVELSGLVAI